MLNVYKKEVLPYFHKSLTFYWNFLQLFYIFKFLFRFVEAKNLKDEFHAKINDKLEHLSQIFTLPDSFVTSHD